MIILSLNKISYAAIIGAIWVVLVTAECPRGGPDQIICSGRGECDIFSRCQCSANFEGPSCELRNCPTGVAWNSAADLRAPHAAPLRTPHAAAPCSARGSCDRTTGRCVCQPGFEGAACERMSCPRGLIPANVDLDHGHQPFCSGHGLCTNLERLASENNYWDFPRPLYTEPWDKDKIYGCLCDEGYSGYDCSLRECPVGDDPLLQNREHLHNFRSPMFQAWRDKETRTFVTKDLPDYSSEDRRYKEGAELVHSALLNEAILSSLSLSLNHFHFPLLLSLALSLPTSSRPLFGVDDWSLTFIFLSTLSTLSRSPFLVIFGRMFRCSSSTARPRRAGSLCGSASA